MNKLVSRWSTLVRNSWCNPFRPWSEQMAKLMGAKCWWDTIAILHPLPFGVAIFGAVLLAVLPVDILYRTAILQYFTDFMGWLVPGIPVFAGNAGSQPLLLVHALNWLFVPYWFWLTYRAWPILPIIREKRYIKNIAAMPPEKRTRSHFIFLMLAGSVIFPLALWATWSGFVFIGGPPTLARRLVYENIIQLTFWNWFIPMNFVISIYLTVMYIALLPVLLRMSIFGRIK